MSSTASKISAKSSRGWDSVRQMVASSGQRSQAGGNRTASAPREETQGARMWDKVLGAASHAKDRIAHKYNSVRDGGYASDDDTMDNTHITRALCDYYIQKTGSLPDWLAASAPPTLQQPNATAPSSAVRFPNTTSTNPSIRSTGLSSSRSQPTSLQAIYGAHPSSFSNIQRQSDPIAAESRSTASNPPNRYNPTTDSSRPPGMSSSASADRLRAKLRGTPPPSTSSDTAKPPSSRRMF